MAAGRTAPKYWRSTGQQSLNWLPSGKTLVTLTTSARLEPISASKVEPELMSERVMGAMAQAPDCGRLIFCSK
jgi:hypothetical protein